jgi:hypothetical protein
VRDLTGFPARLQEGKVVEMVRWLHLFVRVATEDCGCLPASAIFFRYRRDFFVNRSCKGNRFLQ